MSISQVDLEEITRHRIWPCLTDYRKKFKSSSLSTGNKEYKSTHDRCDKSNVIVRAEWSGARKHVVFSDSDVVSDGRGAKDYCCLRSNSRCPSLDSKRLQQLDWYPLIWKLWISEPQNKLYSKYPLISKVLESLKIIKHVSSTLALLSQEYNNQFYNWYFWNSIIH